MVCQGSRIAGEARLEETEGEWAEEQGGEDPRYILEGSLGWMSYLCYGLCIFSGGLLAFLQWSVKNRMCVVVCVCFRTFGSLVRLAFISLIS